MAENQEAKSTEEAEVQEVAGADEQAARRIQVDDRGVDLETTDYWHMSGTPEEVVIRFGSTKQSQRGGPVKVTHRMAVSYFTAKRLVAALAQTVKRYEAALNSMDAQQSAGE